MKDYFERRIVILIIALLGLCYHGVCLAEHTTHIKHLSELKTVQTKHVTANYNFLSKLKYTANLNIYSKETKLPWWDTKAPQILKILDFSNVNGRKESYNLNADYRLIQLPSQGHWGKVYILEHLENGSLVENVCAVKVLFSRPEYNKPLEYFRQRHKQEIDNNLLIKHLDLPVAYKLFGIIEIDADHYLIFTELGSSVREIIKEQPVEVLANKIDKLLQEIDNMHSFGFTHGDLKLDNMLYINNDIKLCDWYSLYDISKENVGKYRYIGDNLPPEAMRAFYFNDDYFLQYSQVEYNKKHHTFFLHPIAADRFCLAISLLEIFAPHLYQEFEKLSPAGFNPYRPKSLDFWDHNAAFLTKLQLELSEQIARTDHTKLHQILMKMSRYVSLDPLSRV